MYVLSTGLSETILEAPIPFLRQKLVCVEKFQHTNLGSKAVMLALAPYTYRLFHMFVHNETLLSRLLERLRWSRVSVLAFGTQVRWFKPGRSCRIFSGRKILSTPSFGGEVKPSVPCRRFMACERSLNVTWKSGILRENSSAISRPSSSSFHY